MRRFLLLSLVGCFLAGQSVSAQSIYDAPPSARGAPQIQRLPPVEPAGPVFDVPAEPVASQVLLPPEPPPAPKIWQGDLELGLNGSEGNSQTFNIRFGAEAKRKTKCHVLSFDLDYHKNTNDSMETAHRSFLDWRYERLFEDSPWTWFVHGTVDYDEFQAFDLRVSLDTGLGYQLIKTEATSLLSRAGGGWSREIGGPDDRDVPEAVFGMDFEHQVNKRQKLTATVDYAPDVTDFGAYRLNTKAGWEALLDESMNLSLKVSVLDRYDSTPNGVKPNDIDYAVTLLWSF
jgi:putative salt-induced outer membrane protein YdiY